MLICYDFVTIGTVADSYSRGMRIETVQPLFSFLEGGLFIHQANALLQQDDRRPLAERAHDDFFSAPEWEGLDRRQVLRLLAGAVTRLVGSPPPIPSEEDRRVPQTILALYRGFCGSFLRSFPHHPPGHALMLKSFLDRIVEKHLGQAPPIEYGALNRDRWKFLIDAGERLLQVEFPVIRGEYLFDRLVTPGSQADLAWLEEAEERLQFEVESHHDFLAVERFGRAIRPGKSLAWRNPLPQFEPGW